jgi:glycosyltransferase involved in cell wall biosynthesis
MVSENGENLVFILSLPRSGSTLLSAILGNHGKIYSASEPWFLLRLFEVNGNPVGDKVFDDYFASVGTKEFLTDSTFVESSRAFALQAYNSRLRETGRQIFIDKTPRYYHILNFVDSLFPKAVKIWLKRNPLDVAASYKSTWNIGIDVLAGKNIEPSSFDFLYGLPLLADYFQEKSPQKYEVKYEDIVLSPEETMRDLCSFCGIQLSEEMLDLNDEGRNLMAMKNSTLGDKKILNHKSVHAGSLGRWTKDLSGEEIKDLVEAIGVDIFRRQGYEDTARALAADFVPENLPSSSDLLEHGERLLKDCDKSSHIFDVAEKRLKLIDSLGGDINVYKENIKTLEERIKYLELMREAGGLGWFLALNKGYNPPKHVTPVHPESRPGLISVIIPVYNGERFLRECVTSVWNQEPCGYDLEIFVIDDCSKDGSLSIAEDLARQSPVPMQILRHPGGENLGVSASRNLGLSHAQGEWVCMLDADDAWEKDKLKTQIEHLKSTPDVGILCSYGYNIDENGKPCTGWTGGSIAGDYTDVPPPHDFKAPYTLDKMIFGCPVVVSTVIVRREIILEVGGFKEGLSLQGEDWLVWSQITARNHIQLLPEPLIRYRVHPESWTTKYCREDLEATVRFEYFIELLHWMFMQNDRYIYNYAMYIYKKHFPFFIRPVAQLFKEMNLMFKPYVNMEKIDDGWLNISHVRAFIDQRVKANNVLRRRVNMQKNTIERQEKRLAIIRKIPGYRLAALAARAIRALR